ncbi:MAG: dihydroorotase [Christensenellales bacterium]
MKLLIKGGTLVNPLGKSGRFDILTEGKKVIEIGSNIACEGAKVIFADGCCVMPGLVDIHCHLREPGYEYKEDIESGTKAAAKGGFTAVVCMPNTNPVIDNAALVTFINRKAREVGRTKVYPIGAVSKGLKGEELSEIGDMAQAGAVAFSDDGRPVENGILMLHAMQYANSFQRKIVSHCEDFALVNGGAMNEGYLSASMGLAPNTPAAEEVMIARECILSLQYGIPVHIAHVSTKRGAQIIQWAKSMEAPVTAETTPHYIAGDESLAVGFNTDAKVNPPLRSKEDRAYLQQALKEGVIDCIATDHAPHHSDEKEVEFASAASGISGFESAFSLCYTTLVDTGLISMERLVELMSSKGAQILQIPGGVIQEGETADITVADLNAAYRLTKEDWISKGKNTPFFGREVKGKIVHTIVEGVPVFQDGKLTGEVWGR